MGLFGALRRHLAPIALFAGLGFFGVSLLVLGTGALDSDAHALDASTLAVTNGTSVLLYPTTYFGHERVTINVTYAFPKAAGDAFLLTCRDAEALVRGDPMERPLLRYDTLRQGAFVVSRQTVDYERTDYIVERESGAEYCSPSIAFRWAAPDGDPAANRPTVAAIYDATHLDEENVPFLIGLMVGGALLALLGGLSWARRRSDTPPPSADDSTVEALRSSLDRMGHELERTRRHLLFAGVLGIFLWYPILVPWTWRQAKDVSDNAVVPWAIAGAALAFLIALTILWAREFLRLDRELRAWRSRLGELRDREDELMDSLEGA